LATSIDDIDNIIIKQPEVGLGGPLSTVTSNFKLKPEVTRASYSSLGFVLASGQASG
jgi:hypothetical protein